MLLLNRSIKRRSEVLTKVAAAMLVMRLVDLYWGVAPAVRGSGFLVHWMDFLAPLGLTPYAVAKAVRVPRTRIERLAREATPVTADTALRLGRYFGTSAQFWMNLQARHDLEAAEAAAREALATIEPHRAAA